MSLSANMSTRMARIGFDSLEARHRNNGGIRSTIMKVFVRKNNSTPTGYMLVTIGDDGREMYTSIDRTYPGEPFTLVLPANDSNRKYFNSKKVEAAGGEIELTFKESKTLGPRTESAPRKGLEEYLEGEDKATYLALVEKAKKAREEANKKAPMTDLEKAQRRAERAQAEVERLTALLAQQNA